MLERNFTNDVKLNKYKLDQESEEFSSVYHLYLEEQASLKTLVEKKKDQLELARFDADIKYRQMDDLPGEVKKTESSIKAFVEKDEDVKHEKKEYFEAKKELNTITAAVIALESKKSQLENLRYLWIAGYYSDSSRSKTSTTEAEIKAKKSLKRRKR
ncbi:MAG: hypothetical protein ACFFDN_02060 [Candidatus Hodarchaeota archaeon]